MTDWVKIRHTVTGGTATVAASALGAHVAAGWLPVDDPYGQPAPASDDQEGE
jgi:hypothetical protein